MASLNQVIPPPERPTEVGDSAQWSEVESRLKIHLPEDYRHYITTYGTGSIGGFLWVHNPFASNPHLNLIRQAEVIIEALSILKNQDERECPYALYPEEDGLLPWATTNNGDVLFWRTRGRPQDWTVVINEARGPAFEHYDESTTSFLEKLLTGIIMSEIITCDLFDRRQPFTKAPY